MPTYDYKCKDCGHVFERFQSMNDEPLKTCEECGGRVKRVIGGGSGIIFKGSGFYVNDYKPSSTSSTSAPEKKAADSAPPCGTDACCCNNK